MSKIEGTLGHLRVSALCFSVLSPLLLVTGPRTTKAASPRCHKTGETTPARLALQTDVRYVNVVGVVNTRARRLSIVELPGSFPTPGSSLAG